MLLSIIVPVYNVEAYLNKCVGSLLDQDLSPDDYEIILVDDGSTDSSGKICDELADAHKNIRVIHRQNGGLSKARNTGIDTARGQYVQFVDADDYLNTNVLGAITRRMVLQNLDILRINYQNVNEDGKVFEPNKYSKPFVDYSEDICDGLTFLNERLGFACYAVQFVTRTTLLQLAGNNFREGIYFEDVEWTPRILLQAERVASMSTMVYNYLYRHNSITRNVDLARKRKALDDKLFLVHFLYQLGCDYPGCEWFDGMVAQTVLSILLEVGRFFYPDRKKYIRELKKMNVFPLSLFHATPAARRKIRVANLSPEVMCHIHHFRNSQ